MTYKSMGCFLIGVTGPGYSANDEALLGSVSDDPYDIRTFLRVVSPKSWLAHIGTELISTTEHTLTERGYFANPGETTRGINKAGLAFTCAMVFEDETVNINRESSPFAKLTEKLMRSCETVTDAINLFQSSGTISPAFSVLLADTTGDLAHLEVGRFGINVNHHYSHSNPGMVFAVNCYLSQKLLKHNAPDAVIENKQNNNLARRERGKQFADQYCGQLDVSSLARLLSDHANCERSPINNPLLPAWGYSICNHGTRNKNSYSHEDLPWGTVSAEILQPSKKVFWYAYGWPCGQQPKYNDQLFQEKSWGKFVPFGFANDESAKQDTTELTTIDGEITTSGLQNQTDQQHATVNLS